MLLNGISLEESPGRDWALSVIPWLRDTMTDVAGGIGGDVGTLLDKQQRYTAYAGALTEIYAKAEAFYKTELAKAMEEAIKEGISPSLVARVAEGRIATVIQFYEAIHRLNTTLSEQLVAISSRLKFEKSIMP